MDINKVLESLCVKDARNPDCILEEEEMYSGARRKDGCSCDNCFYRRAMLAEEILRLIALTKNKSLQAGFEITDYKKAKVFDFETAYAKLKITNAHFVTRQSDVRRIAHMDKQRWEELFEKPISYKKVVNSTEVRYGIYKEYPFFDENKHKLIFSPEENFLSFLFEAVVEEFID